MGHAPAPADPASSHALCEKQLLAIELLLQGQPLADIASALAIDRKTLYRWRQDTLFQQELAQRHEDLRRATDHRLNALLSEALDVMQRQVTAYREETSFRAAAMILRLARSRQYQPRAAAATP